MSTDRELLEMAAKVLCFVEPPKHAQIPEGVPVVFYYHGKPWDPLEDNNDALLLLRAIDCGLLVEDGTVKIVNDLGGCIFYMHINGDDEMRVIRRAITKAAAEEGRRMS